MILAFGAGVGQAWYMAPIAIAIVIVGVAAIHRPRVTKGRRTTELTIGQVFRAFMSDDAEHAKKPPAP